MCTYILYKRANERAECEKCLDISLPSFIYIYIYVYVHTLYYRKNSALTLRLKRIKLPFRSVLLCVLCIHTNLYIYIIQEPIYTYRSCWTTYTRARHTRKGMHMKIIMVNMDLFNRTFFVCDVFLSFRLFFHRDRRTQCIHR